MAEQSAAASHWDEVYSTKDVETVSWHQRVPTTSLRLIGPPRRTLVDIGAGASPLVDHLLQAGWIHVTLLDVSATGLDLTLTRLVDNTDRVGAVVSDVLSWSPDRTYDVWHDRAVLHFLTDPADRAAYAVLAARTLGPGGRLVIGGFAPDGPTHCSGMPTARRLADELAAEFGERFDLEHTEHETHMTPSGSAQEFTWIVMTRR